MSEPRVRTVRDWLTNSVDIVVYERDTEARRSYALGVRIHRECVEDLVAERGKAAAQRYYRAIKKCVMREFVANKEWYRKHDGAAVLLRSISRARLGSLKELPVRRTLAA